MSNEITKHEIKKASEVDIDALNCYLSQPGVSTGEDRYVDQLFVYIILDVIQYIIFQVFVKKRCISHYSFLLVL